MFKENNKFEKFESKVWLSSPTMHGPEIEYVKEAYEAKKWAFVTDYARLWIIYHYGGIYLDTDVEIIKPLDSLLENEAYFGLEDNNFINTGVGFGAKKGNDVVFRMMSDYSGEHFSVPVYVPDVI